LSALSLMHRAALMAVALALATTASAQNAHATYAAKTQRRLAATTHRHLPAGRVNSETRSGRYSGGAANMSAAGRRTPDEVGRSAGLAIRDQRALRQAGHSAAAAREWQARYGRRYRMGPKTGPRLERTALRPETRGATRRSGPTESVETYAVPGATTAETDEPVENADVETVPPERAMPVQTAQVNADGATDAEAASKQVEVARDTAGDTARRADSASAERKDEVASLSLRTGRMPAPLRGSLASLERQNDRSDAEGLERIEDEADLAARIADKLLVPLPASIALTVNPDLEENHRYCRPWTAKFLADLARAHEAAFHRSIEVSSAVRTVAYQKRLMETNGNAAPAEGDMVSPHLTGATIDIAKKGLSRDEIAWMRRQLADLQTAGKIDVEEEFKQSCFHITVYKSYVPAKKAVEAAPAKAVARGVTPDAGPWTAEEPEARRA
jgi:hypothetical protein